MTTPFSLSIFVADGDPEGLRVAERSKWIGKALIFPRPLLPEVKVRDEPVQTGAYLLGPREDIDKLLLDKLPEVLTRDQKLTKIHNLISSLSGKRIRNTGTRQASQWILSEHEKQ